MPAVPPGLPSQASGSPAGVAAVPAKPPGSQGPPGGQGPTGGSRVPSVQGPIGVQGPPGIQIPPAQAPLQVGTTPLQNTPPSQTLVLKSTAGDLHTLNEIEMC